MVPLGHYPWAEASKDRIKNENPNDTTCTFKAHVRIGAFKERTYLQILGPIGALP